MTIQERKTVSIETSQPHEDGSRAGALRRRCWFPVNSLGHPLRGALASEPTHTRCSLLLLLGKAGWLQTRLANRQQDAGGRAEPACALAMALPHGSGGQGGRRDPSEPISGSWGSCGERSVLQRPILQPLKVSCPGLTPRWLEGSPAQPTETHVPAGPRPAVSPGPPVSASPHFLPTGNPPGA